VPLCITVNAIYTVYMFYLKKKSHDCLLLSTVKVTLYVQHFKLSWYTVHWSRWQLKILPIVILFSYNEKHIDVEWGPLLSRKNNKNQYKYWWTPQRSHIATDIIITYKQLYNTTWEYIKFNSWLRHSKLLMPRSLLFILR